MSAVVFDLDGTLIDSAPDLHAAGLKMLEEAGLPPVTLAQTRAFIGNGMPKLVERLMRAAGLAEDTARHAELLARFRVFYDAEPAVRTQLYPGVAAVLERLAKDGHALGICTNKPEAPTLAILDAFGLSDYFGFVAGGDTLPVKKPDPAPLELVFAELGRARRVYVGDSETDAETARAVGVRFALFTEGYRKTEIDEIPHHYAFSRFDALPEIVETAIRSAA